ncbi:uncharacterized protein LOC114315901 [Camellia sinensis]|uniref:uncharacterized protein LOC114315901 n=1 Tax=Camellia sinensis TaxID=4442 RepID=UPI001035DE7D|nr:uncharacterized protein LOC114315901 [Camellia sinensis]
MRTIVRSVRQFQSVFRRRGYTILTGLSRKQNYLASACCVYRFSYNGEICRYSYPYMISRALFADAAKVANGEVSKAGPLIEYERRIEAGDLVDGDNCQVLQSIHSSCLIISFKGKASSLYVSSEFSPAQKVTFLIFDRNFPWFVNV